MSASATGSVTCVSIPKEPRTLNLAPCQSHLPALTRWRRVRCSSLAPEARGERSDPAGAGTRTWRARPGSPTRWRVTPGRNTTAHNALEVARITSTTNATTTRSTFAPDARPPSLPALPVLSRLVRAYSLTAFPSPTPTPLLILMLDHLPLAAAPPPAPLLPGLPCHIYFVGRGRGVQREAVDPPSSKAQALCGLSSRRRGGGPFVS